MNKLYNTCENYFFKKDPPPYANFTSSMLLIENLPGIKTKTQIKKNKKNKRKVML